MFFLLIVCILSIYAYLKWHYSYWKRRQLPGPEPTLIVGNLGSTLTLRKHFSEVIHEWYTKFPEAPFIGYFKMFEPAVMIHDPELIKDVLIKDQSNFAANDFALDESVDLLAHNPFLVNDKKWKHARSVLTPLFTGNKIKQLFPLMLQSGEKLKKYILSQGENKDLEAKNLAAMFIAENVAKCGYSIDGAGFEEPKSEFRMMGNTLFQPTFLARLKFLLIFFCPLMKKLFPFPYLPKEVDVWMRQLVSHSLKLRSKKSDHEYEDVLQMVLNSQEKQGLTDEEVIGYALAFFVEGYDTSSIALSFAAYHLAKNPEVQEKLHREIEKSLNDNSNTLTFDVLQQINYLEWVMLETLRLSPPATTLNKICTKLYTLKRKEGDVITGINVHPGTPVIIPILAIHMDPAYFPNPERFEPERFTAEARKERTQLVYFPFGEGPRMCLGMSFAMTQTKLGLLTMVKNFKITLSPKHKQFKPDAKATFLQARDGLLLNFTPRQ